MHSLEDSLVMDIEFECDGCRNKVEAIVDLPDPNFAAEKDSDSEVEVPEEVYCDNCGHEHQIIINNSMYSASCYFIHDNSKTISYSTPYYLMDEAAEFQWIIENQGQFHILEKQLDIAETLYTSDALTGATKFSSNIMVFAYIVAALEGYLSSSFIHHVMKSDDLKINLLDENPDIKDKKFKVIDIIKDKNFTDNFIKSYLSDFTFHNVAKITILFKKVLNHEFGEVGWLYKAVAIRHDCAHRAGITKDGQSLNITNAMIADLILNVKALANNLETTIAQLSSSQLLTPEVVYLPSNSNNSDNIPF